MSASFRQMGRSTDALEPMRKAAALSPGDAEAHHNLGTILKDLGRLDEAEAAYQRSLEIKPDSVEAMNPLALMLHFQGQSAMALNTVMQSLMIKKNARGKRYLYRLHQNHTICT